MTDIESLVHVHPRDLCDVITQLRMPASTLHEVMRRVTGEVMNIEEYEIQWLQSMTLRPRERGRCLLINLPLCGGRINDVLRLVDGYITYLSRTGMPRYDIDGHAIRVGENRKGVYIHPLELKAGDIIRNMVSSEYEDPKCFIWDGKHSHLITRNDDREYDIPYVFRKVFGDLYWDQIIPVLDSDIIDEGDLISSSPPRSSRSIVKFQDDETQ